MDLSKERGLFWGHRNSERREGLWNSAGIEYRFVGNSVAWEAIWNEEDERGLEESFRFEGPYCDLEVRYDNGQLCTFKRKAKKETNDE